MHVQVLIKWTTLLANLATWEDYEALKVHFPDAPAWGPVGSYGEGNVMNTKAAMGEASEVGAIKRRDMMKMA